MLKLVKMKEKKKENVDVEFVESQVIIDKRVHREWKLKNSLEIRNKWK